MNHLIESINEHGLGIAGDFRERNGQIDHRWFLVKNERRLPILQSVESTLEWPPSPPVQQFSIEEHDSGTVAMGLGMAGNSHWSVSFQFDRKSVCIVADIACRTPDGSPQLVTTYQLLHDPFVNIPENQLSIESDLGTVLLCGGMGTDLSINQLSDPAQVAISPLEVIPQNTTWRWTYRLSLSS